MNSDKPSGCGPLLLRTISLSNLSKHVNNVNLDEEIIVFRINPEPGAVPQPSDQFPIRFDGLLMVLLEEGEAHAAIDLEDYTLAPGDFLTVNPRHYMRSFSIAQGSRALGLACSRGVVEMVLPKITDLLPLMVSQQTDPLIHLEPQEANGIRAFHDFISAKLSEPKSFFLKHKIVSVLRAALFELMDIRIRRAGGAERHISRDQEILARFVASVADNFKSERHLDFYARQLCISKKHLAATVKKTSGRTPGEWIEHYVIMEARVLLRTTDLTIQQIATELNFATQGFFGKYFRCRTGVSPTAYRLSGL